MSQDDKMLVAMQEELKKFRSDLECLRDKVKKELPVVQKSLLANDLHATTLVIESIREHYSKELEVKRQAVRDAAALRLEMIEADQRKKEVEDELRLMYDPSVNSPRRNELKRKLQVYEETLETMMKKLGDVSVDRITTLFTQMKHSKATWNDAVRDAEARCEELRRENNVLQEALKSVYEREAAPTGDVLRRLHEVNDKLEIKSGKSYESERKLTQLHQLMALVLSGLLGTVQRISKVAHMDITETMERLGIVDEAHGATTDIDKVNEEEENEDPLDIELPMLVHQYQDAMTKILKEIRADAELNDSQALRNFKGFAPLELVSTSSTIKHPIIISVDPGNPVGLGLKAISSAHSVIPVHSADSRQRALPALKADSPPQKSQAAHKSQAGEGGGGGGGGGGADGAAGVEANLMHAEGLEVDVAGADDSSQDCKSPRGILLLSLLSDRQMAMKK